MIRLLLVDDCPIFCAQFRGMLHWEDEGVTIESVAHNGLEAINQLQRHSPDIILTDINMPLMNGINLIEYIHRYHPALPVIVLSAYDDFGYVRSSLKLGAQDYLLKHELCGESLLGVIKGAVQTKQAGTGDHLITHQETEEFFVLLLSGWYEDIEKLQKRAAELSIHMPDTGYYPIVTGIDSSSQGNDVFTLPLAELLRETLSRSVIDLIPISSERLLLLEKASLGTIHTQAQRETLQMASDTIWRFFGLRLSFGIGDWCSGLRDLPKEYKRACERYDAMHFLGRRSFTADQEIAGVTSVCSISLEVERQLAEQLERCDEMAVSKTLDQIFLDAKQKSKVATDVSILFVELQHFISRAARQKDLEMNMEDMPTFTSFASMDELHTWFMRRFSALIRMLSQRRANQYGEFTCAAIDYIHQNYCEHISLKDIAKILNVNASYLSRLFKAETSENLVAYLNDLRIGKAQLMLKESRYVIKDIASRVGFRNYNYFFTVFKEKTGLTPMEYRHDWISKHDNV